MGRVAVLAFALAGCGRIGFDARGDAGVPGDVPDGDAALTFGAPAVVLGSTGQILNNPTVREDELEMFVVQRANTGAQGDIFVTTRATPLEAWGPLAAVPELNTGGDESGLHIGRTGLTMWFASVRTGGLGAHDIYRATRTSFSTPWDMPVRVDGASTAGEESSPAPDAAELSIVVNVGNGPRHLHAASRSSTIAAWPTPVLVTELAMFDEHGPALTPDGLTMYYAADRTGDGTTDLYVTRRASLTSPFETPAHLPSIASEANEFVPWISSDERVIYFVSDRTGQTAIYRAER